MSINFELKGVHYVIGVHVKAYLCPSDCKLHIKFVREKEKIGEGKGAFISFNIPQMVHNTAYKAKRHNKLA